IADARRSSDELFSLTDDLVCRGSNPTAAVEALNGLVDIRRQLDVQGTDLDLARQRADQLIDLKDRVVSATPNLATATENLELMGDIQEHLAKVAQSFGQMRHWIIEILAFEPVFNRAIRTLQPLTELGNVRHMNSTDLRQVIRQMNERRGPQWSATP